MSTSKNKIRYNTLNSANKTYTNTDARYVKCFLSERSKTSSTILFFGISRYIYTFTELYWKYLIIIYLFSFLLISLQLPRSCHISQGIPYASEELESRLARKLTLQLTRSQAWYKLCNECGFEQIAANTWAPNCFLQISMTELMSVAPLPLLRSFSNVNKLWK